MDTISLIRRAALVASAFALFCSCDGSPLSAPEDMSITGLHFTTSPAAPGSPAPTNVDVTVSDQTATLAIYQATVDLPMFPPGVFNCPVDLGFTHSIAFTHGTTVVMTATLKEGGCRSATISGAPPVRQTNDAYWALVASNLGVEESALFSFASPL